MRWRSWASGILGSLAGLAGTAQAAQIASVSPQGEVAQVRQVVVRFDSAVAALGDAAQPDPVRVDCTGAAAAGQGRWLNDRAWVFDFAGSQPPGVRCTVQVRPEWKPLAGALTGRTEFRFATGGPAVVQTQPWASASIEEDQHFILILNGPAAEAGVPAKAWCEVQGLAEKLPLRLLTGAPRDALLKSRRLDKAADRTLVVDCGRPLPADAAVRLVWGKGIAAKADPALLTSVEQRFAFKVRPVFRAEFSCERERAEAPCLPIRPLTLRFSAPVPRASAAQVRLQPDQGAARAPWFDPDDKAAEVSEVVFKGPLPEKARFTIQLPAGLKDVTGRALANAGSFPLAVATGDAPPIAKFAAAPFGVIEHDAESMLPVTLRHVQGDLRPQAAGGRVRVKRIDGDADVLAWFRKLARHHESALPARELGLPESQWWETVEETDDQGRIQRRRSMRQVATREVSLLAADTSARRLDLPQLQGGDPRPFEVVGIPLPEPGYHVVEIESRRLGQALLDQDRPMFVRTGVLVTNLGVHFKQGRENSLVWVTTLDRARPVADAEVAVYRCDGQRLWSGRTGADGTARAPALFDTRDESCPGGAALFVTARKAGGGGPADMAFVFSDWVKGIEPWRFNVGFSHEPQPDWRAHTVFDRTLLRAGETVSMKHFLRVETAQGLAPVDAARLPDRVKITHEGSDESFTQPITWQGNRSALSSWNIPPAAKLGRYRVELERSGAEGARGSWTSGEFRVEAFRVPLVDARLMPPTSVPAAPAALTLQAQLNHQSGGGVAAAPLKVSALLRPRDVQFTGYDDFSFAPPRTLRPDGDEAQGREEAERLVADKLAFSTDRNGAARIELKNLPALARASELQAELSFADPNGEVQTVATRVALWPSDVVLGLRTASWASGRGEAGFTVLALTTDGKPIEGQPVSVRGRVSQTLSTRKRLVGGFYAYDNRTEVRELGSLCSGRTDRQGRLACRAQLDSAGQVELIASATDAGGRATEAASTLWVTRQGELWFEQDNDDRIDLLPEKRRVEPGETARLQVRMPYREATALVAVEREGVIHTELVTLRGDDPTIELKIDKAWAPNVYVSVLALRGRIRDVPWYSFFRWGWRSPLEWARAFWYEGREYRAPTAMVDLAKPSFKLGVAALQVGLAAHELQVAVTPDKSQYTVRGKAVVKVQVTQGGRPVPEARIAFAAVDEGLLALRDNESWQLLPALLRARAWGVQTSTAHGEIVGRRHYGRKALPAGGGGGRGATRELFDTLLLWRGDIALDAQGEARVEVPLNDSLTAFRLVAVADEGQRFGTGVARITVSQDLQMLSGLPPLVRDGDRFAAMFTLRNTTAREMTVRAALQGSFAGGASGLAIQRVPIVVPAQDLKLPAGGAALVQWPVDVPADGSSITWEAAVDEQGGGGARDRLKITQLVAPAVPVTVQQATLQQLDGSATVPVAAPAAALRAGAGPGAGAGVTGGASAVASSAASTAPTPGATPAPAALRGGLLVAAQPRLSGALPGIRRFFETYPFSCLEQKTSKAVGLKDAALWAPVAAALPTYLDSDGLAAYFPLRPDDAPRGSDRLTAYVLAATHEAGFALPDGARERMLQGLTAFVEGRIERRFWSPRADLDVRKLAAIEALSRHGRAQARMLGSINLTPNLWPTAALIDWLQILRRVSGVPDAAQRAAEAQQILRSRLSYGGSTLRFSREDDDFWWWLMDSPDANAARLILAVLDDPTWKDELPRLVVGALGRQQRGAWLTTTANLWGSLALDKFSARFESTPISGQLRAAVGASAQSLDWSRQAGGGRLMLPWPEGPGTLQVTQDGSGKPWLTVQALAAVPLTAPVRAGYAVSRTVTAVERKDPSRWSRGDVMRVRLEVDAQQDFTWVVVSDPVPAGASILGGGLGRDSQIATRGERSEGRAWPAFEERGFDAFRSYFEHLPRGRHVVEYTLRLNNPGRFQLPPTRVEAMYAPESFGALPNAPLEVAP